MRTKLIALAAAAGLALAGCSAERATTGYVDVDPADIENFPNQAQIDWAIEAQRDYLEGLGRTVDGVAYECSIPHFISGIWLVVLRIDYRETISGEVVDVAMVHGQYLGRADGAEPTAEDTFGMANSLYGYPPPDESFAHPTGLCDTALMPAGGTWEDAGLSTKSILAPLSNE